MTEVEIAAATIQHRTLIGQLLELYAHDFSEFTAADVDDDGHFGYREIEVYWTDADRHPFLIRVDDHIAGFVLVRSGSPHDMAEFFVLRKYRRFGVGAKAARAVLTMFPGDWQVRQLAENAAAIAFWRAAIPVPFEEAMRTEGCVQRFTIASA